MRHTARVVVVGAGYAGLMAVLRLARRRHRAPLAVTLVNASPYFIERIRLHQLAAGQSLRERPLHRLLAGTDVGFVQGVVTSLDTKNQTVTIHSGSRELILPFDRLVYALGSRGMTDGVSGAAKHALAVGNQVDAARLADRLPAVAAGGGSVAVVGGGLTGIETAAELAESYPGLRVRLVTAGRVGAHLSDTAREHILAVFDRLHVERWEEERVTAVDGDAVLLASGERLPADLCVWAGSLVAPLLAREAGLAVNASGQVLVDEALRSLSAPNVFAAGDAACAAPPGGRPLRMACATAMPLGAHAADNVVASLTGGEPRAFRFAYVVQCISLGRRDGIIQWVRSDDAPTERVWTGRLAAWVKEGVCRYTILTLRGEGLGWTYRWPTGRKDMASVTSSGYLRGQ